MLIIVESQHLNLNRTFWLHLQVLILPTSKVTKDLCCETDWYWISSFKSHFLLLVSSTNLEVLCQSPLKIWHLTIWSELFSHLLLYSNSRSHQWIFNISVFVSFKYHFAFTCLPSAFLSRIVESVNFLHFFVFPWFILMLSTSKVLVL